MTGFDPGRGGVWVFHRAALGDGVLLWPELRALARRGGPVTLVTHGSHARLAAHALGDAGDVAGVDAESPDALALWSGVARAVVPGVRRVIAFIDHEAWWRAAGACFPGATLERRAGRPDGAHAARLTRDDPLARVAPRFCPRGPVLLHVGAGAPAKRWALERWTALRDGLAENGMLVRLLAGPAEAERFTPRERDAFERADGAWLEDVIALHDAARGARLFVGADSGPTHLAAQTGVPTLALFGVTDPAVWAPVGPGAAVLSAYPAGMDAIGVGEALDAARALADRVPSSR